MHFPNEKILKTSQLKEGIQLFTKLVKSLKVSHRKHSRSVLESIGQAWHASVVWEARVAVARRQRRIKKRLLCGVMCLCLVLLSLS